jgi:hypothetical protein
MIEYHWGNCLVKIDQLTFEGVRLGEGRQCPGLQVTSFPGCLPGSVSQSVVVWDSAGLEMAAGLKGHLRLGLLTCGSSGGVGP